LPFQPALAVGNNRDLVCTLSGKTFWPTKLCFRIRTPSSSIQLAGIRSRGSVAVITASSSARATNAILPSLVLVPRQPGADDRTGPGSEQAMADRYATSRSSVCFNDRLADCRLGCRLEQVSTSSARWRPPAVCCLLALASLTYRQVGYLHDTERSGAARWR